MSREHTSSSDGVVGFREWHELQTHQSAWNELAGSNFMLRTEWLESWWQAYRQPGERLAIAGWLDPSGEANGFIPGFVTRGLLGRTYRWLASGVVCSDDVRLVCSESDSRQSGQAAARWLSSETLRSELGRLDAIEIEGYQQQEPTIRTLIDSLCAAGWSLEEQELDGAWRVSLPSSLEAFVGQLHKSRRRKVNKAKRLLAEGAVSYEAVWDWPRIDALWSEFVRLHQKRREALGQPGCFADPRFGIFLKSASERFAAHGGCFMGVLSADNQPIALNLNFVAADSVGMYQSGIEMDRTELEPGHLLNYFTVGTAIEQGMRWFDFLRGDEPYKEGWGAERRGLYRARLFAPHLLARLRQSAIAAGREFRNWSTGLLGGVAASSVVTTAESTAD